MLTDRHNTEGLDCQVVLSDLISGRQNPREQTAQDYDISGDSILSASHPSLTFNPLTYNAPMSGAGVRSTEASAPLACWASFRVHPNVFYFLG